MTTIATRTLADLKPGEQGIIAGITGDPDLKRRLLAMGIVKGVAVRLGRAAPMGDPRTYVVLDYTLSLRNVDARKIALKPDAAEGQGA